MFRQARHRHNIAHKHDDEARARRNFDFANSNVEIFGASEFRGVIGEGILSFGNANGELAETELFNLSELFFSGGQEGHTVRAGNFFCGRQNFLF